MLVRLVTLVVGVLQTLYPRSAVDLWMRLATVGDPDVELRSWVYTVARIEGLFFLLWALRRWTPVDARSSDAS